MAVSTIAIQGKVVRPDGVDASGGEINIRLTVAGSIDDAGTSQVIGGKIRVPIGDDGSVSFSLAATDAITPLNGVAAYRAEFEVNDLKWVFIWDLPAAGANPRDIGDITVVESLQGGGPLVLRLAEQAIVVTALPSAGPQFLGVTALLDTGSGETSTWMCHRSAAGIYDWVYSGGNPAASLVLLTEPPTTGYSLGDSVFINPASGETQQLVLHRNASDVIGWVQVSSGGA